MSKHVTRFGFVIMRDCIKEAEAQRKWLLSSIPKAKGETE